MVKISVLLLCTIVLISACGPALPPVPSPVPSPTLIPVAAISSPTPTAGTSSEASRGAASTPSTTQASASPLDPLTGLKVADSRVLDRRPLAIKVENLPRNHRPQWGLSLADLVYEYYTEQGTTRFAAIYYGQDAERVGPIRSARFFDANVIRMYKAVFAFGSAYQAVLDRFHGSEYADRLVVEKARNCPPMCRFEPNGANILVTSTADLSAYATKIGIQNGRQKLDGMTFQSSPPTGGKPAQQVFVRFSGAIYNRWDYDPASGKYLRWVDKQDDLDRTDEVYVQLTDRLTNQPISAANVVVLEIPYSYIVKTPEMEVFDMDFIGSGMAYAIRDGQIYPVKWKRENRDDVVTLVGEDGLPFPLKPGITWFEVVHTESTVVQKDRSWRFTFVLP